MSDSEIRFYPKLTAIKDSFASPSAPDESRLEPSTCKEAEPFALRVLDDSMQPEFRSGCIIVIDPTGRATDGSYVLADLSSASGSLDEGPVFRQLRKDAVGGWMLCALNEKYPETTALDDLSEITGVIVQRAGVRRRYHKHYT